MRIIFSRVKQELEYFLNIVNSEFDKYIPFYLIKINDDYHYEMFLKLERTKTGWSYDYINHQVYYSEYDINNKQLKELIELLKKDKRSWKDKFPITKQKKSNEMANKYLGLKIDYSLVTEISDNGEGTKIKEYSTKSFNLGVDEEYEYEFINKWANFSPFQFMNQHQFKPFLDDVRECYEKHKWTILTNQEAMEEFLDSLPDILKDIKKTGNSNFLKWLIEETKKCILGYRGEISDEFKKILDFNNNFLKNLKINVYMGK